MTSWRRLVGAALVVASLAVANVPAGASGHSSKPTTTTTSTKLPSVAVAVAAYRAAMRSIDADFSRAVARANHALALKMKRAKTSAARINARFEFRRAIVRATDRREVEVEALDSSPIGQIDLGDSGTSTPDGGSSNADH